MGMSVPSFDSRPKLKILEGWSRRIQLPISDSHLISHAMPPKRRNKKKKTQKPASQTSTTNNSNHQNQNTSITSSQTQPNKPSASLSSFNSEIETSTKSNQTTPLSHRSTNLPFQSPSTDPNTSHSLSSDRYSPVTSHSKKSTPYKTDVVTPDDLTESQAQLYHLTSPCSHEGNPEFINPTSQISESGQKNYHSGHSTPIKLSAQPSSTAKSNSSASQLDQKSTIREELYRSPTKESNHESFEISQSVSNSNASIRTSEPFQEGELLQSSNHSSASPSYEPTNENQLLTQLDESNQQRYQNDNAGKPIVKTEPATPLDAQVSYHSVPRDSAIVSGHDKPITLLNAEISPFKPNLRRRERSFTVDSHYSDASQKVSASSCGGASKRPRNSNSNDFSPKTPGQTLSAQEVPDSLTFGENRPEYYKNSLGYHHLGQCLKSIQSRQQKCHSGSQTIDMGVNLPQIYLSYFDQNQDGMLDPLDSWRASRRLGFGLVLAAWITFLVHAILSLLNGNRLWFFLDPLAKHHLPLGGKVSEKSNHLEKTISKLLPNLEYLPNEQVSPLALWKIMLQMDDLFDRLTVVLGWLLVFCLTWPVNLSVRHDYFCSAFNGDLLFLIAERNSLQSRPSVNSS
ncbi:hypothetical protein O181_005871 [Austropuccinia psidii MF-1]|uniref:Uncharacterized protein n=1 Tax=Austropuccinia psidii MF-1 TaxID=1389203 RepID=A0A9Q3BI37_9BASI|nr:hypothetical protein [Austropuccinia psidii MF-1]